ncbi:MAG: hypothetical protein OEW75_12760, partial [Cyclobacteriaceae bacterium]|nr:hypothetical protein [Cyclobacteriaceae bacterium]
AFIFNASTRSSGTGNGDCPNPSLYTTFPFEINSFESSFIANVAEGFTADTFGFIKLPFIDVLSNKVNTSNHGETSN